MIPAFTASAVGMIRNFIHKGRIEIYKEYKF